MEAVDFIAAPAKKFAENCHRVLKRCTIPSTKIIKKTALSAGTGFLVLGTIGFVFKLVSIPINNVIIGSMAK